jgi:LPS sulfotransferase NodH
LLAKGLDSTNLAGLPHEYFNVDHKKDYIKRWEFNTIQEYIYLLKENRVSNNGVFGLKLHFNQYELEFGNDDLSSYFDGLKYVFITRKDKISQGISLEKALQTNKWSSEFKATNKAVFKYKSIRKRIVDVTNQESKWLLYFKAHNIKPYIVNYEDLDRDYEETILNVLTYLGLNENCIFLPKQIQKQRNISNYFWKKAYQVINLFVK